MRNLIYYVSFRTLKRVTLLSLVTVFLVNFDIQSATATEPMNCNQILSDIDNQVFYEGAIDKNPRSSFEPARYFTKDELVRIEYLATVVAALYLRNSRSSAVDIITNPDSENNKYAIDTIVREVWHIIKSKLGRTPLSNHFQERIAFGPYAQQLMGEYTFDKKMKRKGFMQTLLSLEVAERRATTGEMDNFIKDNIEAILLNAESMERMPRFSVAFRSAKRFAANTAKVTIGLALMNLFSIDLLPLQGYLPYASGTVGGILSLWTGVYHYRNGENFPLFKWWSYNEELGADVRSRYVRLRD